MREKSFLEKTDEELKKDELLTWTRVKNFYALLEELNHSQMCELYDYLLELAYGKK